MATPAWYDDKEKEKRAMEILSVPGETPATMSVKLGVSERAIQHWLRKNSAAKQVYEEQKRAHHTQIVQQAVEMLMQPGSSMVFVSEGLGILESFLTARDLGRATNDAVNQQIGDTVTVSVLLISQRQLASTARVTPGPG
jgi:hypothetical protein